MALREGLELLGTRGGKVEKNLGIHGGSLEEAGGPLLAG